MPRLVNPTGQSASDRKGGLNTPLGRLRAPTVAPRGRSNRRLGAPRPPRKAAMARANLHVDKRNLQLHLEHHARVASPTLTLVPIEIVGHRGSAPQGQTLVDPTQPDHLPNRSVRPTTTPKKLTCISWSSKSRPIPCCSKVFR